MSDGRPPKAVEGQSLEAGPASRPSRIVTFLLTDVEGSTRLWQGRPGDAAALVDRHEMIIRDAVIRNCGEHLKRRGEGDSTFNVFDSASSAVSAAVDLQKALETESWPRGEHVRVRAALHTGEAEFHDGDYLGTTVNRCARLRSIGHGGQVLLTVATAELVRDQLPDGTQLRSLGAHRLKDLSRPETVFQLEHPDLPRDFPALLSLEARRNNLPAQRTPLVGRTEVLDRIMALLPATRLLTLTGVGGCGKTRLAIETARLAQPEFPTGCTLSTWLP
jgi:class 3 adenylate cyclase